MARHARALVAPSIELRVEALHGVPPYDGDLEQAQGMPAAVDKEAVRAASGVIVVTPEYNNAIPGVFKNALAGCRRRRPGAERCSATAHSR